MTQVSQIISSVAHDLRSPLNAVIGFSRIMIKGLDGPLSDMQLADLEAVHVNGQAMLDMINDLIDIAKIDAGALEPGNTQVYFESVLDQVLSKTEPRLRERAITIQRQSQDLLISVQAETLHIQQLLVDLLAVAAGCIDSGQISISVESDRQLALVRVNVRAPEALLLAAEHMVAVFRTEAAPGAHRVDPLSLKLFAIRSRTELYAGTFSIDILASDHLQMTVQVPTIRSQT